MKFIHSTIAAVALTFAATAAANDSMRDIGDYTCRDILVASGAERDLAIMFLQGYFVGKSGKTTFDRDALADATDRTIDMCLEATDEKAVTVMARALKAAQAE